ncbi:hypothetical protein QT711_13335 [Sporosarcina saromensis]|uniref:Uncharacterized protein n=1 Tax=Sporosarcina saromensis TaxID=359365 RepID=A0ABU4GCY0_9BACL|nr:hypothetical protein [Sporosarcina saromensis]MDW0114173.1 hypothetical protein [Sporosarcina saromensis]
MNYSTAKWLIGILFTIGLLIIATYFFMDEKGILPSLFVDVFVPLVFLTWLPALLLIIGLLIAQGKKEDKISNKTLGRSAVVIAALFAFRWLTGYFN